MRGARCAVAVAVADQEFVLFIERLPASAGFFSRCVEPFTKDIAERFETPAIDVIAR